MFFVADDEIEEYCPDCGTMLERADGSYYCPACGWVTEYN